MSKCPRCGVNLIGTAESPPKSVLCRYCVQTDLRIALEESVKLQSHYASLLNMHDGGQRMPFANANAWMDRLRTTGTLKTP